MKSTKHSFLFLTCVFATGAATSFAAAETAIPATFYDAGNWYGYRSNANVSFSSGEDSITFSGIDSSSYLWAYFEPVTLSVGQKLSFFGTFTFGKLAADGVFSVGLFDGGQCSKSEMITHSYQSGTEVSSMANYTYGKNAVSTATGGMTGVSANARAAYLRTNSASSTAFLSTASGAQQKTVEFEDSFPGPDSNAAYDVGMEILKTSSGLDFSVRFGGGNAQLISFETDISTFDVPGIRVPVASGESITFSAATVTVPEPSFWGVLSVFLLIAPSVCLRRVQRHKKY